MCYFDLFRIIFFPTLIQVSIFFIYDVFLLIILLIICFAKYLVQVKLFERLHEIKNMTKCIIMLLWLSSPIFLWGKNKIKERKIKLLYFLWYFSFHFWKYIIWKSYDRLFYDMFDGMHIRGLQFYTLYVDIQILPFYCITTNKQKILIVLKIKYWQWKFIFLSTI